MEKVSLVAAMGDDGIGGGAQDASRSGGNRGLLEGISGLRPVAVRGESSSAEKIAAFEDGSEEVLTRRRSGSLPIPNATNSPRVLKPVSIIFAPPNNLARYCQPRGSPTAADARSPSITLPWVGVVTWKGFCDKTTEWLRNPRNWALGIWGVAVFISGAVLFMVMVGMLDNVLPRKADRDLWFEASNQTINALFTLFVLLLHPLRVLHLVWLLQWRRRNIPKLRALYCKDGMPKPNEWTHMLVVLLLYQLNCFAQYAVCALNWCYTRAERPVMAVVVCFVMALGAGCAAGIYTNVSPLGKAASPPGEDDAEDLATNIAGSKSALPGSRFLHTAPKYDRLLERNTPSIGAGPRAGHVLVDNPQWQGGVLECWEAPTLVPATVCCFPCVLGHNLSRLGFGNRYVHIVTFLLACFAPFVIFEFASINVDSRCDISLSLSCSHGQLKSFFIFFGNNPFSSSMSHSVSHQSTLKRPT